MRRALVVTMALAVGMLGFGSGTSSAVDKVLAGDGLKGGGRRSTVRLRVSTGPGISIVNDSVQVGFAGSRCGDGHYLVGIAADGTLECSCLGGICSTQGYAEDPAGDAIAADIVSAEFAVGNGNLTGKILFAPGTFDITSHIVSISFDVDQDPNTGSPAPVGMEYRIRVGANCVFPAGKFGVYSGSWTDSNLGNVTAITDGVIVSIPISALGNDDGAMDIKVASFGADACGLLGGTLDSFDQFPLAP